LRLDEEAATIALFDRSLLEPPSEPLKYERPDSESLRLRGTFDGVPIRVTLRREEDRSLFHTRGFRWISEVPFNR
jgi:hypothetical protein